MRPRHVPAISLLAALLGAAVSAGQPARADSPWAPEPAGQSRTTVLPAAAAQTRMQCTCVNAQAGASWSTTATGDNQPCTHATGSLVVSGITRDCIAPAPVLVQCQCRNVQAGATWTMMAAGDNQPCSYSNGSLTVTGTTQNCR